MVIKIIYTQLHINIIIDAEFWTHHNDVIMSSMATLITSLTIVSSIIYSMHRSKNISKLHVTGLCEGNSPVTSEFPAQRASNAENVSIWWRHHGGSSVPYSDIYPVLDLYSAHITEHIWLPWWQLWCHSDILECLILKYARGTSKALNGGAHAHLSSSHRPPINLPYICKLCAMNIHDIWASIQWTMSLT